MRTLFGIFLFIGAGMLVALPLFAEEADPVAVLKSNASYAEKSEACRVLQVKGGPESIGALEALLTDEKLSHMARLVLEGMPYPEAGGALRGALAKTSGQLKMGVISSLAVRRDAEAVPALSQLLGAGTEPDLARAAAQALGIIATPEAAQALKGLSLGPELDAGTREAFSDAQLRCADALLAAGQGADAAALYRTLLDSPDAPKQAAAFRGVVLTSGDAGIALLTEAIGGDDEVRFAAALRIARELPEGEDATAGMAAVLPSLSPTRKIALLDLLAKRGGEVLGPPLLAEAATGPTEVRVAALSALTRIGYAPALEVIKGLLREEDKALAEAACHALSYFPGEAGDAMLTSMAESGAVEERRLAIELIGKGGLPAPAELLMKAAERDSDEGIRLAALQALRDRSGMPQMERLLARLSAATSAVERDAVEGVLAAFCARQGKAPGGDIEIVSAEYGAFPDGPKKDVTEKAARLAASGTPEIGAHNGHFGDTAPGKVKQLRITYRVNNVPVTQTATEGGAIVLRTAVTPQEIVDAFRAGFAAAQGPAKLAMLRLLAGTGNAQALESIQGVAQGEDAALKAAALRELCEWPGAEALPAIMELAAGAPEAGVKTAAVRGAVRLLGLGQCSLAERVAQLGVLMDRASGADEKKLVLSGLAQIPDSGALDRVFAAFADEGVKAEAVQAAIAIAKHLGAAAREEAGIIPGADLAGWQGGKEYWRVEEGAVVGHSDTPIPRNEFCWAPVEVGNFYLALDVKLEPPTANAGVQFRSHKADAHGQALGYQADMGQEVWGRLYHEHGRGKLDWTDRAEKAVKPDEWNRYEILAIGPAIWTAINGTLGVACLDLNASGADRAGGVAVQIHAGPPQTARYRFIKLVHNPPVALAGLTSEQLMAELKTTPAQP